MNLLCARMLLWPCSTDGFTVWQFLAEIKAYREELEQLEKELTKHTRNGNREKIAEARHVFLVFAFINSSVDFVIGKLAFFLQLCEERDRRLAFIDKQRGMMTGWLVL